MLDQYGEVEAFNMRVNPALKTTSWSYDEELGKLMELHVRLLATDYQSRYMYALYMYTD